MLWDDIQLLYLSFLHDTPALLSLATDELRALRAYNQDKVLIYSC